MPEWHGMTIPLPQTRRWVNSTLHLTLGIQVPSTIIKTNPSMKLYKRVPGQLDILNLNNDLGTAATTTTTTITTSTTITTITITTSTSTPSSTATPTTPSGTSSSNERHYPTTLPPSPGLTEPMRSATTEATKPLSCSRSAPSPIYRTCTTPRVPSFPTSITGFTTQEIW